MAAHDSRLSPAISELAVHAVNMSGSFAIWKHKNRECFQQDAAGPVKVDLISSRPARSWSLHEICLTKASANVTMVQFFFWKLTQLTDQLHSTGEIKGCGEGRGFTTFKITNQKITSSKDRQQAAQRAKETNQRFLFGFH